MERATGLGGISKIRIRLHYTWFVAFVLVVVGIVVIFPAAYPMWQRIALGVAADVLFLASMAGREIVRNFVAVNRGIPVKNVTLFVFGGVPQIAEESTSPILELLLAAVGLLSSLIIAGIFYGVYFALAGTSAVLAAGLVQWLGFINIMLVFFNLIPGFPLDGGRALRAFLWMKSGNYARATRITVLIGRGIGFLFIIGGILAVVLASEWFAGLLLVFVGWLLERAAAVAYREVLLREALHGVTAQDIMSGDYPLVAQQLSLGQLVRDYVLRTGQRYFVVVDEGGLQGIVTLRDIKSVPQKRWDFTRVGEIMIPASELRTAYPGQLGVSLLGQMDEWDIHQVPVLEGGRVVGVVARDDLVRFRSTRAELGM